MYSDCDDAGSLATLHVFADRGKVELLGMCVCSRQLRRMLSDAPLDRCAKPKTAN